MCTNEPELLGKNWAVPGRNGPGPSAADALEPRPPRSESHPSPSRYQTDSDVSPTLSWATSCVRLRGRPSADSATSGTPHAIPVPRRRRARETSCPARRRQCSASSSPRAKRKCRGPGHEHRLEPRPVDEAIESSPVPVPEIRVARREAGPAAAGRTSRCLGSARATCTRPPQPEHMRLPKRASAAWAGRIKGVMRRGGTRDSDRPGHCLGGQ